MRTERYRQARKGHELAAVAVALLCASTAQADGWAKKGGGFLLGVGMGFAAHESGHFFEGWSRGKSSRFQARDGFLYVHTEGLGTPSYYMAGFANQAVASELVFALGQERTAVGTGIIAWHVLCTAVYVVGTEAGIGGFRRDGDMYNFKRLGGRGEIAIPLLASHALWSAYRLYRGHTAPARVYPTISKRSVGIAYNF